LSYFQKLEVQKEAKKVVVTARTKMRNFVDDSPEEMEARRADTHVAFDDDDDE